jgi:hypothetical protein
MKKILYIATVDMFTRTGGGLATLAYYNAFKSIFGNRLDLMHAQEYFKGEKTQNVILQERKSLVSKIFSFLNGHVHRFYPDIYTYLKQNTNLYEIVIINGGVFAGDSIKQIKSLGIKTIIIHHNLEREYHMENKTLASFGGLSPALINHWEKISYINADINLFLTKYDLDKFGAEYGFTNAKNFVTGCFLTDNIRNDRYSTGTFNSSAIKFVCTGALNFKQTQRGIYEFIHNIFNHINSKQNNYTLIIAGRTPPCKVLRLEKIDGIKVIPSPLDIESEILNGDIYVCPLSAGGGIKMRVMDGLKLGLPILLHKNSVRGYEVFLDMPYFKTYSNLSEFINGLNDIIRGGENGLFSSANIKDDFYKYFSLDAGINRIKACL